MKVLNCESVTSIYESIESAFGIDALSLNKLFVVLKDKLTYLEMVSDDDLLLPLKERMTTDKLFDATCWFHLTRTVQSNKFEQGILPLGQVIDSIWDMLFGLLNNSFPLEQWIEFRKGMEGEYPRDDPRVFDYRLKVHDEFHWGPYAYLLKEYALYDYKNSRELTHYFDKAEVVENICISFKQRYHIDLLKMFKKNTQPCVVQFIDHNFTTRHLVAALRYLYFTYHEAIDLFGGLIPTYDGKGVVVGPECIVTVEFIEL